VSDALLQSNQFILNSAQLLALENAGYDASALEALGFSSVSVTATGLSATNVSSAVSMASARTNMLNAVNAAWNALGLNGSGLNVAVDETSGFQVGSVTVTQYGNGTVAINQATRTIISGQTLRVETRIYADSAGNWTNDRDVASALGLEEIVYYIENPNQMEYKATCTFTFDVRITTGSGYSFNTVTSNALTSAGLTFVDPITRQLTFAMSSRSLSSAMAKNNLVTSAQARVNAEYNSAVILTYTANDSGNSRTLLTLAEITASAISGTNVDSMGGTGQISGNLRVHTGIYLDDNGNWTESASIADLFGLNELVYTFNSGASNFTVSASAGIGLDLTGTIQAIGQGFDGTQTKAGNTLGVIVGKINDNIKYVITTLQNLDPANINVKLDSGGIADPPYIGLGGLNANIQSISSTSNPLSATAFIGGLEIDADSTTGEGFNAKPSTATVSYIAEYLADSIAYELGELQSTSSNDTGLIYVGSTTIPPVAITLSDLNSSTPTSVTNFGSSAFTTTIVVDGAVDSSKSKIMVASAGTAAIITAGENSGRSNFGAWALASAINNNADSQFWAMIQSVDSNGRVADMVYVFTKEGGNYNDLLACDVAGSGSASRVALDYVNFENVAAAELHEAGTSFTLGGEKWGTMKPTQTKATLGNEVWNVTLNGRDVGAERDLWIANAGEIDTPALLAGIINGMDRNSFVEIQNAADSPWIGGEIRTQSAAQAALDAITESINTKDKIRADLGALQNRLENTMTNLTVQAENLQASESRISDVDVATEMTEFTRNNVLAQAATSMLAQANSLSQLALSLIG
jgi:flagellin-like hook-associated protein FlgL